MLQKALKICLIALPLVACKRDFNQSAGVEALSRWPIRPHDAPECRANPDDVFEPAARLWKGSGEGQCLNMYWTRPVMTLKPADAQNLYGFTPQNGYRVVANIFDTDRFYVAQIPVQKVSAMIYQIAHFQMGGGRSTGHGMVRVTFSEPIRMVEQFPIDKTKTRQVNELVLSVHAGLGREQSFDLIGHGMDDSYVVLWAVYTLRNKVKDSLLRQGNRIEQIRLDLTPEKMQKVLESYLSHSESFSYTRTYHSTTRNCGTEQLTNFNFALGTREPTPQVLNSNLLSILSNLVQRGKSAAVADMAPSYAFTALKERGLIRGDENRVPDLADDPSVQSMIAGFRAGQP